MTGGGARDVPGGAPSSEATRRAPGDSEETGVQTGTRGQSPLARLDPGSPFAGLKQQDAGNGYVKVQASGCPIAMKDGRVRLHRLVLFHATEGKDQACALCDLDGLNWSAPPEDKAHHLTVDHINSDKLDDRETNLRATHKWCNENRHGVDRVKVPWAFIATIPVADRKPCWNHVLGCPTPNAYAYQRQAQGEEVPAVDPPKPRRKARQPIRPGWTAWDDLYDRDELDRGRIVRRPVPAALLDCYPQLHRIGRRG